MTRSLANEPDILVLLRACGARRWLRACLTLGLVLAIGLGGLSCSGGGDSEGGDSADDPSGPSAAELLLEEAEEAMSAAEKAGADKLFADDFKKNVERIQDGKNYLERDNPSGAKAKFRFARDQFRDLAGNVVKVAELRKEALAAKPEIDKLVAEAKEVEADKLAKREFEQAETLYKRVLRDIESGDEVKIKRSRSTLNSVQEEFQRAIRIAKQNEQLREAAVKEKELLAEWQTKAKEAEAEKYAVRDFLFAQQLERDGDTYLAQGDFLTASRQFKEAARSYAAAIQMAATEKELAQAAAKAGSGVPTPGVQTPTPTPTPPIPTPGGDRPPTGTVDVGDIPSPLGGPDALIQEHIARLAPSFKAGSTYDPGTREVVLDYSDANTLRRDIAAGFSFPKIGRGNKYLEFRDITQVKAGGSSLGGPGTPGGGPVEPVALSFAANTEGRFLVGVPLKPPITIDYDVNLQFIEQKGRFGPLLFSTPDTSAYWWVDYITFHFQGFKKPLQTFPWADGVPPDRRRPASRWFDKVNIIHMQVAVEPDEDDPAKSRIKVYYDNELEPSNVSIPLSTDEIGGYVGFRWHKSRVNVSNLQIRGVLDAEKALEALAEKGVDVSSATPPTTPAGDDDEKSDAKSGDTPTTPPRKRPDSGNTDDFDF